MTLDAALAGPGYTVTETLYEGAGRTLWRAIRRVDQRSVVLKALTSRHVHPKDLERLRREYELQSGLDLRGVVRSLGLDTYQDMPVLVLEDFGGQPLDRMITGPMEAGRFLELAAGLAAAVAELHEAGVIHKDIKPENILVRPGTLDTKLTDLGLATRLPREQRSARPPQLIEGSLPYMSPEQTGLMNRVLDNRSDLYSLGVTFFQILTGRLPFDAHDPLEWVHDHVARVPPSPAALVPEIPEQVSLIILRLLEKMADDRYQTARGLRHDLLRCLDAWREYEGLIEPFPLGERDMPDRLRIPQRLYGREEQVSALLRAFDRVGGVSGGGPGEAGFQTSPSIPPEDQVSPTAAEDQTAPSTPENQTAPGQAGLVLVSGRPGVGKTALVQEAHRPLIDRGGVFVTGKFEQYKRDVPYSTVVESFGELLRWVLAESEERIGRWRARIESALGDNGRLMVDLIPQLELIIGPQPEVPALPPAEAESRLQLVFRRFFGVFTEPEHPLAIFLDDLQWADAASLRLIADLIGSGEVHHLLLIGAYRDIEVDSTHPLSRMINELREGGATVTDLVLAPLSCEDIGRLVADTVRCSTAEARPLAEVVCEKTGGNPYFAVQFLTALHRRGLLWFDRGRGRWGWDIPQINEEQFTDNVVDLMIAKIRALPDGTQQVLRLAAAVGADANTETLAALLGHDPEPALRAAVEADLLLPLEGTYRFGHDRVQEAAYALSPEDERARLHLRIGRHLLERTPHESLHEKIFVLAQHLNLAAAAGLVTDREERERLAELNLLAGTRAKASSAHASALTYLVAGSAMLEGDRWDRLYDMAFALEHARAECEYQTGALDLARDRLDTLWEHATGLPRLAAVTGLQIVLFTTMDRSDLAVQVGLRYLRRTGLEWVPHPPDEEVEREFHRIWAALGNHSIEGLIDLPAMTDPEQCATADILLALHSPAMFTDDNLHCLVVARLTNLSLQQGNSEASSFCYVLLGMLLGSRFGDYQTGFRFGRLGLDLLERRGQSRFAARVYLDFGCLVNPWARHLRNGLVFARRAFDTAQETGDLTYAAFACNNLITLLLAKGDGLEDVQAEAERALAFVRRTGFGLVVDIITTQLQLIRMLRGLTGGMSSFDDVEFDEREFERHLENDPRLAIATCWYWIRKLQARHYAGDHRAAVEAAERARPLLWTSPSFFEPAEFHFYGALARAAHHDEVPPEQRPDEYEALVAHHRQLTLWAENCPENFADRAALVGAEIARLDGDTITAEELYETAISAARDSGFVHNEALAYETAAGFYLGRGRTVVADAYLSEARACYQRWGAAGKVGRLERQHPRLLERIVPSGFTSLVELPERLDLLSVVKASQVISGEVALDGLVRTLLDVVLQQSGAQTGHLFLFRDGTLFPAAEAALADDGVRSTVLGSAPGRPATTGEQASGEQAAPDERTPLAEQTPAAGQAASGRPTSPGFPASIVNLVQRTGERVLLYDATAPNPFSSDEYIARHRPRSVLCLPIRRHTGLVGVLYLENRLVAGGFTPERLSALELLAAQAAISVENALAGEEIRKLNQDLEARVARRTAALEQVNQALAQANKELETFSFTVSHDLHAPLRAISNFAELLREKYSGGLDDEGRRYLGIVSSRAIRMGHLIDHILAFTRMSRIDMGLEAVDITALAREIFAEMRSGVTDREVEFQLDDLPPALCDRAMIRQVVVNLLGNALKYTAGRPRTIIRMSGSVEGEEQVYSVTDNGVGFDQRYADQLFGVFQRLHDTGQFEGAGLGLAIVRRVIERHGGRVWAEGTVDQGAAFFFTLPATPVRVTPAGT